MTHLEFWATAEAVAQRRAAERAAYATKFDMIFSKIMSRGIGYTEAYELASVYSDDARLARASSEEMGAAIAALAAF